MIKEIKDKDFMKFKTAVTQTIKDKINAHPAIANKVNEFQKLQNIKSLFGQINKNK